MEWYVVDLTDRDATESLVAGGSFDAVIHFAGLKAVGESVELPLRLLPEQPRLARSRCSQAMQRHGVRTLVFSSSATVYGEHAAVPIDGGLPRSARQPVRPDQGACIEQILRDAARRRPVAGAIALLRYFNPVGAHASGHDRRGPGRHPEQPDAAASPRSPSAAARS